MHETNTVSLAWHAGNKNDPTRTKGPIQYMFTVWIELTSFCIAI